MKEDLLILKTKYYQYMTKSDSSININKSAFKKYISLAKSASERKTEGGD